MIELSREWFSGNLCRVIACELHGFVVIPKEGYRLHNILESGRLQVYSRCHTKRRICEAPSTNGSFGMTTTRIFKDGFLRYTIC